MSLDQEPAAERRTLQSQDGPSRLRLEQLAVVLDLVLLLGVVAEGGGADLAVGQFGDRGTRAAAPDGGPDADFEELAFGGRGRLVALEVLVVALLHIGCGLGEQGVDFDRSRSLRRRHRSRDLGCSGFHVETGCVSAPTTATARGNGASLARIIGVSKADL